MFHFTMDGFGGHRSRFDDIRLIHELLEELPVHLGLTPAMPPMILPYYNGVEPDDCGTSGFVFLPGGHLTIHTFSFRECFFVDMMSPIDFDQRDIESFLRNALPVQSSDTHVRTRPTLVNHPPIEPDADFGPHLLVEIDKYTGPRSMDGLFSLFDTIPGRIGMTPIMRPYLLRSVGAADKRWLSAMTMIAESHIAMHLDQETDIAYLDIFSCKFFDTEPVLNQLKVAFPGQSRSIQLVPRGRGYKSRRTVREPEHARTKAWLGTRPK